eukprot:SAG31_NODE_1945_length_6853_cov_4.546491_3_plen_201_part_00
MISKTESILVSMIGSFGPHSLSPQMLATALGPVLAVAGHLVVRKPQSNGFPVVRRIKDSRTYPDYGPEESWRQHGDELLVRAEAARRGVRQVAFSDQLRQKDLILSLTSALTEAFVAAKLENAEIAFNDIDANCCGYIEAGAQPVPTDSLEYCCSARILRADTVSMYTHVRRRAMCSCMALRSLHQRGSGIPATRNNECN